MLLFLMTEITTTTKNERKRVFVCVCACAKGKEKEIRIDASISIHRLLFPLSLFRLRFFYSFFFLLALKNINSLIYYSTH